MIVNEKRGEVAIEINGKHHKLCLTLGALAELETAFSATDLKDLGQKMGCLSAGEILIVLLILLKGGGVVFEIETLKTSDLNPKIAAQKIAECFEKCA